MSKPARSIPYYVISICLSLILGAMVPYILWPAFQKAVAVFNADYSLYYTGSYTSLLLRSLALFLLFIVLVFIILKNRNSKRVTVVFALLCGSLFILSLGNQVAGWIAGLSATPFAQGADFSPVFFSNVATIVSMFAGVLMCLILFLRFRR